MSDWARGEVSDCAWAPDGGQIVSASRDNTLRIWDADSGMCLRTLRGHARWVRACAWAPHREQIVSASSDMTLRIWDAESGMCLRTLSGHENAVTSCAWCSSGGVIASSSEDGTLRLWDSETGCELDRRTYLRLTPDAAVWATIDHRNNRILACDPEAWRILGWRTTGADGMPVILPAETFGPLPIYEPE